MSASPPAGCAARPRRHTGNHYQEFTARSRTAAHFGATVCHKTNNQEFENADL